jgi:hypothetical protein
MCLQAFIVFIHGIDLGESRLGLHGALQNGQEKGDMENESTQARVYLGSSSA